MVDDAIDKIVNADIPVFQFTESDKQELAKTYPVIFLSTVAAKQAQTAGLMFETDEMYVSQLFMRDVDVIYTTEEGCDYVVQKMKQFGNTRVKVICQNSLWKDSDRLTGIPDRFRPSKEERRRNKKLLERRILWREAISSLKKDEGESLLQKLASSDYLPTDFEGSSQEEIRKLLEDEEFGLTSSQFEEFFTSLSI